MHQFYIKKKLIYDCHEVQCELNFFSCFIENLFIKKVDKIINVSRGRAKHQSIKYNININEILIISNYPTFKEKVNKILSSDKINVIFFGGLDLSNNRVDNFIRAMKSYKNLYLDLMCFGYGNSLSEIEDIIKKNKIKKELR